MLWTLRHLGLIRAWSVSTGEYRIAPGAREKYLAGPPGSVAEFLTNKDEVDLPSDGDAIRAEAGEAEDPRLYPLHCLTY